MAMPPVPAAAGSTEGSFDRRASRLLIDGTICIGAAAWP
uniref:Uncharacterized protein n=1 Tax=Arundo donax TaxID=35708 RepID=A0A0A9H4Q6_ARUDO